jgi:hypothetical protein
MPAFLYYWQNIPINSNEMSVFQWRYPLGGAQNVSQMHTHGEDRIDI